MPLNPNSQPLLCHTISRVLHAPTGAPSVTSPPTTAAPPPPPPPLARRDRRRRKAPWIGTSGWRSRRPRPPPSARMRSASPLRASSATTSPTPPPSSRYWACCSSRYATGTRLVHPRPCFLHRSAWAPCVTPDLTAACGDGNNCLAPTFCGAGKWGFRIGPYAFLNNPMYTILTSLRH